MKECDKVLALSCFRQGKYDKAIGIFQLAEDESPGDKPKYNLARCYMEKNDFDRAKSFLEVMDEDKSDKIRALLLECNANLLLRLSTVSAASGAWLVFSQGRVSSNHLKILDALDLAKKSLVILGGNDKLKSHYNRVQDFFNKVEGFITSNVREHSRSWANDIRRGIREKMLDTEFMLKGSGFSHDGVRLFKIDQLAQDGVVECLHDSMLEKIKGCDFRKKALEKFESHSGRARNDVTLFGDFHGSPEVIENIITILSSYVEREEPVVLLIETAGRFHPKARFFSESELSIFFDHVYARWGVDARMDKDRELLRFIFDNRQFIKCASLKELGLLMSSEGGDDKVKMFYELLSDAYGASIACFSKESPVVALTGAAHILGIAEFLEKLFFTKEKVHIFNPSGWFHNGSFPQSDLSITKASSLSYMNYQYAVHQNLDLKSFLMKFPWVNVRLSYFVLCGFKLNRENLPIFNCFIKSFIPLYPDRVTLGKLFRCYNSPDNFQKLIGIQKSIPFFRDSFKEIEIVYGSGEVKVSGLSRLAEEVICLAEKALTNPCDCKCTPCKCKYGDISEEQKEYCFSLFKREADKYIDGKIAGLMPFLR